LSNPFASPRLGNEVERVVKIAVIINPRAGSIKGFGALLKQVSRLAPDRRYTTRGRGSARIFAARAIREGCDYIIAAGGDGTLNEVVNGIGRSSRIVRLGLLPLGTGNDFARCLRLPSTVDENIEILRAGKTKAIDMVKVTSDRVRYFVNVSAGGFSGIVNERLTSQMKKTWGPLAYLRSAAAAFSDLHSYRTRVRFGATEPRSHDLYNVIIANGRYIAGGWPIAPKADPSDGLLDVILIKKAPPAALALLAAKVILRRHLDSDAVIFRRVRSISVRSKPGMWFNVDGELVGNLPAKFEVIPRALQFVVGRK
jgi:diacylglycerol kinase (ATP)